MKNIKKPSKAKESAALLEALTNFPGAFRVWMLRELHDLGCAPRSTLTAQHKVARSELNISLDYIDDTGVYFLVSYKSGQVNIPRHGGVSLLSLISPSCALWEAIASNAIWFTSTSTLKASMYTARWHFCSRSIEAFLDSIASSAYLPTTWMISLSSSCLKET